MYNDGPVDKLFIKLFTQKMADQLEGVHVPEDVTYDDFVRVSKEIMRGRSTVEQREVVAKVLQSLMPEQAPGVFRSLFPASQWSAEINAAIASAGFFWLVGESELRSEPVEVRPGLLREQRSIVHIKKCRYLENSGCVGMCINMCKVPTQNFFTDDFGLPLTMKPDFQTLSCDMIFGQAPPPIEQDEAYSQSCLSQCTLAKGIVPCPKTDMQRERLGSPGSSLPAAVAGSGSSS